MRRRSLKALFVLVPGIALGLVALPTLVGTASGAAVPASFSFSGSGWGHGVGLSQVGARGQAMEGRSATQILRHYYAGSSIGNYRDDMNLRVNLGYKTSRMRLRVEALSGGSPAVELLAGGKTVKAGPKDIVDLMTSGKSVIARKNGTVVLTSSKVVVKWSGTRDRGTTGATASVLNLVDGTSSFTTAGHRYRYGTVEAVARTAAGKTTLSVNNIVRLHDEYLYGIGEMPSLWPVPALQAQVVASRGYALTKYRQGVRGGCDCHVFDDTADQVFVGWAKQAESAGARWTAAVKATHVSATHSKTVLVKGVPAQTFYFSSSGGRTQNSEDVWVSKLSYLRSVDDKWSLNPKYNSNASWGPRVRSQAEVAKAFGLPNVVRLDLNTRYGSGAVKTAKAWSSSGAVASISGVSLVNKLKLTSRWYWTTATQFSIAATAPQASQNSPAVVRGTITPAVPAAGRTVTIRRWDAAKKVWVLESSAKVAANGNYSLSIKPPVQGVAKYAVTKSAESCGSRCAISPATKVINVKVGPRFKISRSVPATAKAGAKVRVSGVVAPAKYSARHLVNVTRYDARSKKWVVVAKVRIGSNGKFSTAIKPLPKGAQQLRFVKYATGCTSKGCAVGGGTSSISKITVR